MRTTTLLSAALASLFLPVSAFAFSDVKPGSAYYDAVTYVEQQGIVKGYSNGTFKPSANINRAEFLKIAIGSNFTAQAFDKCSPRDIYHFSDAGYNEWYSPSLCLAVQHRIIVGYSDNTFHPESSITFVEAAKIIAMLDHHFLNGVDTGAAFDDDPSDSEWFEPFVRYLGDHAAIPTTIASLSQPITRGEMAEIMYRLLAKNNDRPSKTYGDFTGKKETVAKECTLAAEKDETGGVRYPTSTAYAHVHELGPLFTASDCGAIRFNEVAGGPNASFTAGSTLWLTNTPDQEFMEVLKSIGYVCSEDEGCYKWELHKTVPVKELLRLKPFILKIRMDDCINCG